MIFLHYTGHLLRGEDDPRWQTPRERLEQRVADVLAEHGVSRVYGSLACGADLLVVEQALALGIEVVAFVPYGLERFEELSVRMGGAAEVVRYRRALEQLVEVRVLPLSASGEAAFRLTSERAMQSLWQEARVAGVEVLQLALWDGQSGDQGTAGDVARWAALGGRTVHLRLPEGVVDAAVADDARLREVRIASYRLVDEVSRAWRAAALEMREAAVFHAARLLEGIFRTAGKRLGMKFQETYAGIEALSGARCLDEPVRIAAHAVRQVGNDVRHVQRVLGEDEHWIALAFVRLILHWYGSRFSHGLRMTEAELMLPATPHDLLVQRLLHVQSGAQMREILPDLYDALARAPLLVSVAIEKAIDLRLWKEAERLIRSAERLDGRDRRILELNALLHSRKGQPERAIELLERLKIRPYDSELPGILAGAHKRVWQRRGNPLHLRKARSLYLQAWRTSQSPYVGVNAAACLSWSGEQSEAGKVARQVIEALHQQARYWPKDDADRLNWDFYSLATMAEALWLSGQVSEAQEWESHALSRGREQGAPVDIFVEQMALHRQHHP